MTKAEKQRHVLKLMVIALNEAIGNGVIDLHGTSGDVSKRGHIETNIGGLPAVINWSDAGYDELRVTVWWDYRPDLMPTWRRKHIGRFAPGRLPNVARRFFSHILGACGSCHLEWRTGKFIVGDEGNQFFDVYVRECSAYLIDNIQQQMPQGYALYGEATA